MKYKDAISRLRFTISKSNKPNQNDVEALNILLEHLNKTETKAIQENILFAKLYAFVLENFTHKYNSIDFSNKQLNKILSEPMELRTKMLLMVLRQKELTSIVCDSMLENLSPDELKEKLSQYPDISKKYISALDWWTEENVISHLNTNINLSIQNFKLYVCL